MSEALLKEQLELLFRSQQDPPFSLSFPDFQNQKEGEILQMLPDGSGTLLVEGRFLHSRHNPSREARRQFEALSLPAGDHLLLFSGAGLGYALRMALAETENICILFETDRRILSALLSFQDFRDWIRKGRLKILHEVPDESLLQTLCKGYRNQDVIFIPHKASLQLRPDYLEFLQRTERFLNKKDVNLATLSRFDRLWSANFIRNIPVLARARPVSLLFGRYEGCAALICGAGPSLTDSLGDIAKVRKEVLLVAVDTALHILTSAGIDPDFIVTVDPQPLNRHYLEGYSGKACIVADPTTDPHSLRALDPERLFFTWSPFRLSSLFFARWSVPPGEIAFGGSVSTNAYDLACRLGARKIVLVGQDLSFPGRIAHAKGAVLEERWNYRESRTERRELHNLRQMNALPVRSLDAIGGGTVPTNDKLMIFHSWFQNRLRLDLQQGLEVANATARGALFQGIPHGRLEELLPVPGRNEDCGKKFQMDLAGSLSPANSPPGEKPPHFDGLLFLSDLDQILHSLRALLPVLGEGVEICSSLLEGDSRQKTREGKSTPGFRLDDSGSWKPELDSIDGKIRDSLDTSEILGNALQNVILRITENFGETSGSGPTNPDGERERKEQDRRVMEKSLALYSGLLEAAREHIRHISRTKAILRRMFDGNARTDPVPR